MRNKFLILTVFLFIFENSSAENLLIESKKISLDKKNQITIFEDDVNVLTLDGNNIKSDYAAYNKIQEIIELKKNIIATDKEKNTIYSENAEYNKKQDFLEA